MGIIFLIVIADCECSKDVSKRSRPASSTASQTLKKSQSLTNKPTKLPGATETSTIIWPKASLYRDKAEWGYWFTAQPSDEVPTRSLEVIPY